MNLSNSPQSEQDSIPKRDHRARRYNLICPAALRALADALETGERRYGSYNWAKGQGLPIDDLVNHTIEHILLFLDKDTSEPHIAHAIANLTFLYHFQTGCTCHELRQQ